MLLGREGGFLGLIPLIRQFLDSADIDVDTRCSITQYLNFISVRPFLVKNENTFRSVLLEK